MPGENMADVKILPGLIKSMLENLQLSIPYGIIETSNVELFVEIDK